jgi:hypothetical protein
MTLGMFSRCTEVYYLSSLISDADATYNNGESCIVGRRREKVKDFVDTLIHDSDLLGSLHATVQSKPSYLKIIT